MLKIIKKFTAILSLLTFFLMYSIHYAHCKDVYSLFGFKVYKDLRNFYSKAYIDKNKHRKIDSYYSFYTVTVENIPKKSSFFNLYTVVIDDDYIIHQIRGMNKVKNFQYCLKVKKSLSETFINSYNIKFFNAKPEYRTESSFSASYAEEIKNELIVYCQEVTKEDVVVIATLLRTKELSDSHEKWRTEGLR